MIYFLDDEISYTFTPATGGYKTYTVKRFKDVIFTGSVYCIANKETTININDIIDNYRLIEKITPDFTKESYSLRLRELFVIAVDGVGSVTVRVVPLYRYPNKRYDKYIQDAYSDIHGASIDVLTLLQTTEFDRVYDGECLGKTKVLPHIPFKRTSNYGFQHMYWLETHDEKEEDDINVYWYLDNTNVGVYAQTLLLTYNNLDWSNQGYSNKCKLSDMFSATTPYRDTLYMTHSDLDDEPCKESLTAIAKVDYCPAKYYLMWQDRMGGIQSQGFDGKSEYSESITNTTIENFTGHKRIINSQVQPKWSLNTKLLSEEEYPIYESIFVSPYVLLYDVENDKSMNVVTTGKTFTEKTWENQKKAYNFSLEVELDKKQNMLA